MAFSSTVLADGSPNLTAALEQITLITAVSYDRRQVIEDLLAAIGGGSILFYHFQTDTLPPSFSVTRSGNVISVAIFGTVTLAQWIADFVGAYGTPFPNSTVTVNGFFLSTWQTLRPAVIAALPADVAQCTVIFSGHSLGAAVALLGALDLCRLPVAAAVEFLGFGLPKTLTAGFAGPFPTANNFISLSDDAISYLPPTDCVSLALRTSTVFLLGIPITWEHFSTGFVLDGSFTLSKKTASYWDATPGPVLLGNTLKGHTINSYVTDIIFAWQRGVGVGIGAQIVPLIVWAASEPSIQNSNVNVDVANYVNFPYQNTSVWFSTPSSPLTPANVTELNTVAGVLSVATGSNAILPTLAEGTSMPDTKLTFFFHAGIQGFSESYIVPGYGPQSILPSALTTYIQKRMLISGPDTVFDYCRASEVGSPRLAFAYYPGTLGLVAPVKGNAGYSLAGTDQPDSALILRRQNGSNWSLQYLRGIPDVCVSQAGQYTPSGPYNTDLLAFMRFVSVTQGWAWRGINKAAQVSAIIAGIVINPGDGTGLITMATPLFQVGQVGKRVAVRISRVNSPRNLNGPLTVTVVSPVVCASLNQLAIAGFVANQGRMTMSPVQNFVITAMTLEKPGERKAGRPFGVPRGRAPNRGVR